MKTSFKKRREHRRNPQDKKKKQQIKKERDKEHYITLNKRGWTRKGEDPWYRRIIKITTANICTDSVLDLKIFWGGDTNSGASLQ
jgi:hypothetical protein